MLIGQLWCKSFPVYFNMQAELGSTCVCLGKAEVLEGWGGWKKMSYYRGTSGMTCSKRETTGSLPRSDWREKGRRTESPGTRPLSRWSRRVSLGEKRKVLRGRGMENCSRLDSRPTKYWGRGEVRVGKEESGCEFVLFQWHKWGIHLGEESEDGSHLEKEQRRGEDTA